jgi:hypothetical protein
MAQNKNVEQNLGDKDSIIAGYLSLTYFADTTQ